MVRVQCVYVVLLSAFIVGNIIFISSRVKVIIFQILVLANFLNYLGEKFRSNLMKNQAKSPSASSIPQQLSSRMFFPTVIQYSCTS